LDDAANTARTLALRARAPLATINCEAVLKIAQFTAGLKIILEAGSASGNGF
jgi:hypothetical protein